MIRSLEQSHGSGSSPGREDAANPRPLRAPPATREEDIAIVGMACLFPGADTPARFWTNIVNKVDCVTDPPADWQAEWFLDETGSDPDRVYTGKGGYLRDLCRFDPVKYGVMPNSVEGAEPDHFAALRCAFEALADAGYPEVPVNREKAAVILGRGTYVNRGYIALLQHTYGIEQLISVLRQIEPDRDEGQLAALKAELKRNLPPFNAEVVPGLAHSVMVGRIANRLNLKGPAYTIDAACSSSLIALELAMGHLRSGDCDVALAGGVQVSTAAIIDILFCRLQALSRTGRIAPFSSEANGTLLGQGCGMLVLKRVSDALRDGNRIYAVVKSVGVSSDGKGGGLLAPLSDGQQLAVRRAYERAGISPSTIGLIEAHGTGIPLGDATEVQTLKACFEGCSEGAAIALGSVKSMISHLIPAAGVASLIKTALALYHRVLPPTLQAGPVHPQLHLEETPFYLCDEARPWIHDDADVPRRAGVNAFGFGGINTHAILEEHRPSDEAALPSLEQDWPMELVVVSAGDRRELQERLTSLAGWTAGARGVRLLDIAATCARQKGPCRAAICAESVSQLSEKLSRMAEMLSSPERHRIKHRKGMFWFEEPLAAAGRIALMFPGEGAQYAGMLSELCRHFPEVRHQFDLTDRAFRRLGMKRPLSRSIFPLPEEAGEAERELFDMGYAAEAVTTADRALWAMLQKLDIRAQAVVGHSSGEFTALLAGGAIRLTDEEHLLQCIADGTKCTRRLQECGLVARAVLTTVGGAAVDEVSRLVQQSGGRLTIALDNCPHQAVIAGDEDASRSAVEELRRRGALCDRLPWDRSYHTEGFAPACQILEDYYRSLPVAAPSLEVWSCATAAPYPREPEAIRELAVRQWRSPVRFRETIERMYEAGVRLFIEVGPRGNLAAFVENILDGRPHEAVPLDLHHKGDLEQLCRAVGMLAAHGVELDLESLYQRRRPTFLDFSRPAPVRKPDPALRLDLPLLKVGEEVLERLKAGSPPKTSPAPAIALPKEAPKDEAPAPLVPVPLAPPAPFAPTAPARGARERAYADFNRTMQEFLETQKRVMTSLGSARKVHGRAGARNAALAHSPLSSPQPSPPASPRRAYPLLDRVLLHEAGRRLVAECELDLARHPFLLDHTFGRTVSKADPQLTALPVMPLAMTMELMAEAAARLFPAQEVSGMRDLRTHRWLALAESSRRLRVEAAAGDDGITVSVYEADREDANAIVAEAVVELSPSRPPALRSSAAASRLQSGRPSRWKPEDLYTRGLFHGPAFRSVQSIALVAPGGVQAELCQPDSRLLLAGERGSDLVLPVSLIDGAGQIIGFWGAEDGWTMGFPIGLDRLELSAKAVSGQALSAAGTVRSDGRQWSSDVEVSTADGEVALKVMGRRDHVIDIPEHFWKYRIAPEKVVFSRPLNELFSDVPGAGRCTICVLDDFRGSSLVQDSGIWALVLSRLILSRRERQQFADLKRPPAAVASWLLGRVVAKDAVRIRRGLDVCMADVEIALTEHGQPRIAWNGPSPPALSLAHKDYQAIAVAADGCRGAGIDLEPIRALDRSLIEDAFSPDERTLIERTAGADRALMDICYMTGWCAKEAVGKALGRGLPGSPRDVRLLEIKPREGRAAVALGGLLQEIAARNPAFLKAEPIPVFTRIWNDRMVALCLLE